MIESELRKNIHESWPKLFNEYVGFKKFISFDDLEALSGVPLSTLYKISSGQHLPRWEHALMILGNLPASATDDVLRPMGIASHPLSGGEVCQHDTAADIADASAKIAHALRDGRVDHRERAEIRPSLKTAAEAIERWLAEEPGKVVSIPRVGRVS